MSRTRSRSIWHLVEYVAAAISQSYGIARARALTSPKASVRMMAQRHHLYTEATLLERELEICRSPRLSIAPRQRPHFSQGQRAEIMHLYRAKAAENAEAAGAVQGVVQSATGAWGTSYKHA